MLALGAGAATLWAVDASSDPPRVFFDARANGAMASDFSRSRRCMVPSFPYESLQAETPPGLLAQELQERHHDLDVASLQHDLVAAVVLRRRQELFERERRPGRGRQLDGCQRQERHDDLQV